MENAWLTEDESEQVWRCYGAYLQNLKKNGKLFTSHSFTNTMTKHKIKAVFCEDGGVGTYGDMGTGPS